MFDTCENNQSALKMNVCSVHMRTIANRRATFKCANSKLSSNECEG